MDEEDLVEIGELVNALVGRTSAITVFVKTSVVVAVGIGSPGRNWV